MTVPPALLERLFAAVRAAAAPATWSTGIALSREDKVVLESESKDEVVVRVLSGGRGRSHEVMIFPPDVDWQCDCGSREDACIHAVAAVLALRHAEKDGKALPDAASEVGRMSYRLGRDGDALTFERVLVSGGRELPWSVPIGTAPPPGSPQAMTVGGDLEVERAMGGWRHGRVPRTDVMNLLQALSKVGAGVTFEGRPIDVSLAPLLPRVRIEDAGKGFVATLAPDPAARARFRNGVALVGDTLRPIDDAAGISEGDRRQLERGRTFEAADVGQLLDLKARLEAARVPVDVVTKRLPRQRAEPPRLVITSTTEDDCLVLLPTMVYGDPPVARVDRGRLVVLDERAELPVRDEAAEERLVQRLFAHLHLEPGKRGVFEGEKAVAIAAKLKAFLDHPAGVALVGDAHEDYELQAPLTPHLTIEGDGRIDLAFDSDGTDADPARVMRAWHRGWNVAPLEGGGWAPLPGRWLHQYGPILYGLIQAKGERDEVPASAVADVVALCEALGKPVPPRFERLRALVDRFEALPAARLPNDLTAELRHYQQAGVDWLVFHREAGLGALLADDMGLGKTLQALCAVHGRTLVVAPTSVLPNWMKEIERFRPGLRARAYHGPGRALDPTADVTVTSWSILRLDVEALSTIRWDTIVLDESQTIKNPDSQVARAAFRLDGKQRLALTGTPVENRLDDLWSQMRFVEPGLLGDRQAFVETYAEPIGQGNAQAALMLRQRIRPFVLRRMKKEVAPELPPRTELVLRCELSSDERQVYDAIRAATLPEVMQTLERGGGVIAALEALLRLRQAACHRGMIPGQEADTSSKVELLVDLVGELVSEGHKVLVFSQWTSMLDRVEPHLSGEGIDFTRLDGSTVDRGAVVDRFQDPAGPPVLLLSLKAGGTGLNLTAADHVVILDPWWNPATEDQAADRAHRIGQDKPVFVHRLIAADTVEEKILALQDKKRQLADAALGQAAGAQALSKDDLMELLR
ncbi:MAG: DEAD/DEAH box helicase [Deltaproteobacteria bacterium]|nr:DEAD/DEAH box helicase [Deltaproteobacteria bacterium]